MFLTFLILLKLVSFFSCQWRIASNKQKHFIPELRRQDRKSIWILFRFQDYLFLATSTRRRNICSHLPRVDACFFPYFSLIFTTLKRKQAANSNFCYCQQRHGETLGNNRQLFQETRNIDQNFPVVALYQMEHNSAKYTLFIFILLWIFVYACRTFFLFPPLQFKILFIVQISN